MAQTQLISSSGDTYVKSGSPNQNEGAATFLRVQSTGNNRALVSFDSGAIISAVGSGSLAEARLELYIESNANNWGSSGRTVDAHRLLAEWTEDGATWNCGIDSVPTNGKADCSPTWSGGSFAEEPSDSVVHSNDLTGWASFDVTADVRELVAGGVGYGWLIKKTEEGQNGQVDYTAREGTPGQEPRLVLVVESATFDEISPTLRVVEPSAEVIVGDTTPAVRVEYSDGGSGVDLASLDVFVDTTRITPSCSVGPDEATCESPLLGSGFHAIAATVRDHFGNLAQATRSFELLAGVGAHQIAFEAIADTYLRSGSPNQNQGAETLLRVRQSGKNRALIAFDDAAVTAALVGATLHSAYLELTISKNGDNWGAEGRTVNAHRLLAAWSELGATWNCAADTDPSNQQPDCSPQWNGGAYSAAPSASQLHTKGLRGEVRWDVTADVGALLAGETLHGWLMRKADESQSGLVEYAAREAGSGAPRLVVVFETSGSTGELPPDPSTIAPELTVDTTVDLFAASTFLWESETPVQTGVAPGAIVPERICLVRGRVRGPDGSALPGARVTVHRASELGQTLSRGDGLFDLAVNGGGRVTLSYDLEGFLHAFRSFDCPARDWAEVDDVVLVPLDPVVTEITPGLTEMQVARGSVVTDEDGTRQATLMFPDGLDATMVLPDDSRQPLSVIHVRATEYTVGPLGPLRMPAELPENTGYTYAVELAVDEAEAAGAKRVEFNSPVVMYLENFIDVPIGANVPTGSLDRDRGVWVPERDGRVILVLSVSDGIAELDIEGDGLPATAEELSTIGISASELRRLAALYSAGTSLWRVSLMHFSTVDHNWTQVPPAGSIPPPTPEPKPVATTDPPAPDLTSDDSAQDKVEDSPCAFSSVVDCLNRSLREKLSLSGTPFSLAWSSERVQSAPSLATWQVNLAEESLPSNLIKISLRVAVAGWSSYTEYPPVPNQSATVSWPRADRWARSLPFDAPLRSQLCYHYPSVVYSTANRDVRSTFSRLMTSGATLASPGRSLGIIAVCRTQETALGQLVRPSLGSWDASTAGLGGWTISVHHRYNPLTGALYLGDGTSRIIRPLDASVSRYAGTGSSGDSGDGGRARDAQLEFPTDIAFLPDGSVLIADIGARKVRRVAPSGIITTYAGTGVRCQELGCGDGNLASEAPLSLPHSVAIDSDGFVLIGDDAGCIRRVDRAGIISTLAGDCYQGPSPVGSPADILVGPGGAIYFADEGWNQVRFLGTDGEITALAGDTSCSSTVFDVPALESAICSPGGLAFDADGQVLVAGGYSNHVLRIRRDGILENVAGNGAISGPIGDGGPATLARLDAPKGIAARPDGSIVIADTFSGRIRRIAPHGQIQSLTSGWDGEPLVEGMPPARLFTGFAEKVAIAPDNRIFVLDSWDPQVLVVGEVAPLIRGGEYLLPSEDGSEVFVFDERGLHIRTVNALIGTTLLGFSYDSEQRIVAITDSAGNQTLVQRGGDGSPLAIIGPYGQRSELALDSFGYLASVRNPASELVSLEYGPGGLLTGIVDPRLNRKTYSYDSSGKLIRVDDAAGGSRLFAGVSDRASALSVSQSTTLGRTVIYDRRLDSENEVQWSTLVASGSDAVTTRTSRSRAGIRQILHPSGVIKTVSEFADPVWGPHVRTPDRIDVRTPLGGLGPTTVISQSADLANPQDPLSLLSRTIERTVNGRTYRSHFDAAARRFTLTSPAGRLSTHELDPQGRPTFSQVGDLEAITYSYDGRGRLASIRQGTGGTQRSVELSYNSLGLLETITDPLLRRIDFSYDQAGRLIEQNLPGNRQILMGWTTGGALDSYAPPDRPAHQFTYSPVNLPETYEPPALASGSGATDYRWNLDKNLEAVARPDGSLLSVSYDAAQRPVSISSPRGDHSILWEQGKGRIQRLSTPEGVAMDLVFDGPLVSRVIWSGAGLAGRIDRTFDDDLRLRTIAVNGANAVAYTYDADSLIRQVGALVLTRDAETGLLTGTSIGSVTTSYTYNGFGEVQSMTAKFGATTIYAESYLRDALGRIVARTETVQGSTSLIEYHFDEAGRLDTVAKNGVLEAQYTYDLNGNRLLRWHQSGAETGSYDDLDRIVIYDGAEYSYSADGRLSSKTIEGATTVYEHDALGNLGSVLLPNGTTVAYDVDGFNRRIQRKANGVVGQKFLWQGSLAPAAELSATNALVSRFVYATRLNVPDYLIRGGITYRVLTDHLGSPRLIVNVSSGSIVQRMDYDEWGNVTNDTNPGFQPFGFAGGLYDRVTGLVHFGHRDYAAEVGRWLQTDPIKFLGGDSNLYAYALGDPINVADPDGLDFISVGGGAATYWATNVGPYGTPIPIVSIPARSGSPNTRDPSVYGRGPTPPGTYEILEPPFATPSSDPRYCDGGGNCWFVPYHATFPTPNNRCPDTPGERCGMHPDGGARGTAGCTGLLGGDTDQMFDAIDAFDPSPTNPLPVVVSDTMWVDP